MNALSLSTIMQFLPLYSLVIMLMPFFNPVDLRTQTASVSPYSRSPNYAPLYANLNEFATPNAPKYEVPLPLITTVDLDAVSKRAAKSQTSQSGKKYRFNPFKKGTTTSSIKVSRPASSTKPRILALRRYSSVASSKRTSSTTDSSGQTHVPTDPPGHPMIQVPFSALQFLGSPVVYIYRLFKKNTPATIKYSTETSEPQQHPLVREICQVLASSGIHYPDCDPISAEKEEIFKRTTTTWALQDKNGVKWKRVAEGKDRGCIFYLKADPTPLKMSTTPNTDGTAEISYYTKFTVGKYCPTDGNDEEGIRQFYESLLEYSRKPSAFDIISSTKVLFNYTLKNVVEFMFVVDAFVLAAKKVFTVYSYQYWSFRVFLLLYLSFYMGYTYYTDKPTTIQSTVAIETTTIKVLEHVNTPLDVATNASFEGENEGDAVGSKADDNNGTANAVKAKFIHGLAEQGATDDAALPPAVKHSEIWTHLRPDFWR
ncbi:hypothetical protein MAM1_0051d03379 [Mucor ambiguus]|uniref:Uncharacterized protein n=1 Tax=Mucor ambiguus TaxID=91626 RepID=A0A0C9MPF8_9FUNG|nr:hypothetical protein MAM1_0051d03379 [Mucor ambiguus]